MLEMGFKKEGEGVHNENQCADRERQHEEKESDREDHVSKYIQKKKKLK